MATFERIDGKLKSLTKKPEGDLTLNDLFESVKQLAEDFQINRNRVGDRSIYYVEESTAKDFFADLSYVMSLVLSSFEKHKDLLPDATEKTIKNCEERSGKIASIRPKIADIDELVKKERELSEEYDTLKKKKGRADELQTSIERIEKDIAKLDKVSIEDLESRLDDLRKRIKSKADSIETPISEIESLMADCVSSIGVDIEQKLATIKSNTAERERLVQLQQDYEKQLREYEEWKQKYIDEHSGVRRIEELQNKLTAIANAWSTSRQLQEPIEAAIEQKAPGLDVSSYKELSEWFEKEEASLKERVDKLLARYQSILNIINQ